MIISRDSPCYFITAVTKDRLPVFRTEALKAVTAAALDEARRSGGFALFAYAVMPDHLHAVTDSARKPSDTLRFVKGVIAHRVMQYLKDGGHVASLEKLRDRARRGGNMHSVWQHHSSLLLLVSESNLMQRINYIHLNPVRAELAARAQDYCWSSARCWRGMTLEDEPLKMDLEKLEWRRPREE